MKISSFLRVIVFLILINPSGLKSQVIAEAGKDTILCQEDSFFTLGGNPSASGGAGGYKYHWYSNDLQGKNIKDLLNDTTIANPIYKNNKIEKTTFLLIVTDNLGNTNTDSITIFVDIWKQTQHCPDIYQIKWYKQFYLCCSKYTNNYPPFKYLWSPGNNLSDSTICDP